MDQGKLAKQRQKGSAAESLVKHPGFQAACEEVEAAIISDWRNSPLDAAEAREKAWHRLAALQAVCEQLVRAAAKGRAATKELVEKRG